MLTAILVAASLATAADTCPQASQIRATPYLSDSARVEWHPGRGAVQHQIRLRAVGAPSWQRIVTGDTAFTHTGLAPGTRYEFQINTVCGTSISGYTASTTFLMPVVTAAKRRQEMPILSVQVLDIGGRRVASAGPCGQLDEVRPPMPGTYMYLVETAIGQYAVRKVVQ